MMVDFASSNSVNLLEARGEVDFPVRREPLVSEETLMKPQKDLIIREDLETPLGIVSKKRQNIPYADVMDWLTAEFNKSGVNYKLRENKITKKGDMYQEYIFDDTVTSPDGHTISPMVIAKASYISAPLQLDFGTFRFVCSNGVRIGETVGSIRVRPSQVQDLLQSSITDSIAEKFSRLNLVGKKYQELADTSYVPVILEFLQDEHIPMMMKKMVMLQMQEDGNIALTVDKLKREHLGEAVETVYEVVQEQSAWYLYNVMTAHASHNTHSVNGRENSSKQISRFFGI